MPMRIFAFQLNHRKPGKQHPRVSICCAAFKSQKKAKEWAEKIQDQARQGQTGRLSTFQVLGPKWVASRGVLMPRIRNTGQTTIEDILKVRAIQHAH